LKIQLPNYRFMGIHSDSIGEDWAQKSALIDRAMGESAYELAEEGVFLIFDGSHCLVARSVVGPLKEVPEPFKVLDMQSGAAYETTLQNKSWNEVSQIVESREKSPFMIKLARKLLPALELQVSLILRE
jgi:hypothetical protein